MRFDLHRLPDLTAIQRRAKALAMLDAIVCPEWEYRYYSYNAEWSAGQEMASMRNGEGDDWFMLFGAFGAAIKGLAHESKCAGDADLLAEVRRSIPPAFASFLNEPAFGWDGMSFCCWRAPHDGAWSRAVLPDADRRELDGGAADLLVHLIEPAQAYVEFAQSYHEVDLPLAFVQAIYHHEPLTEDIVSALNPEHSLAALADDVADIGFPTR